jgi:hypothetical protein
VRNLTHTTKFLLSSVGMLGFISSDPFYLAGKFVERMRYDCDRMHGGLAFAV